MSEFDAHPDFKNTKYKEFCDSNIYKNPSIVDYINYLEDSMLRQYVSSLEEENTQLRRQKKELNNVLSSMTDDRNSEYKEKYDILQEENEKYKLEISKLNHKISKLKNHENDKLGLLSNLEHLTDGEEGL